MEVLKGYAPDSGNSRESSVKVWWVSISTKVKHKRRAVSLRPSFLLHERTSSKTFKQTFSLSSHELLLTLGAKP